MATHRYKVGQTVSLAAGAGFRGGVAKIVRLMPSNREDYDPQYRVKGTSENHERMVSESVITNVD